MKTSSMEYPQSFDPKALWNSDEICRYLNISKPTFYEIEALIPTFKIGKRRVAFAANVIEYAERIAREQNYAQWRPS